MTHAVTPPNSSGEEPLRIGLFSESFHPVQNGVTTSVLTLVAGLRSLGHHVCVFAPANDRLADRELNVLRFPSFVSMFNRDYPVPLPFVPRLALSTHFNRLRLDVVHTHTPFVLGVTGANLALSRGVPLVSTYHTLYAQYTHYVPLIPEAVSQSFLERYLPWYYNRCTEVICPSDVAANALREQGVERPIEIIPTGIPLPSEEAISPSVRCATREKLGIALETPVLLYAGRLAREKKLDWLLEAFAHLRERLPAPLLLIAGGGSYQDALKATAESLQLGDQVRFLGPTPRNEMDALYTAADVFCFPSPSETQGLVIGEARAAGLPCVVIDSGGAPETVRDGEDGFRIPPGDQEQFVARVAQLVQDEELRRTMRANALYNARNFTPDRMVERILTVYERVQRAIPMPDTPQPQIPSEDLDWNAVGKAFTENPHASDRESVL